jgi:hypothetical protein
MVKTTNVALQAKLNTLVDLIDAGDRDSFVKQFVPLDISDADVSGGGTGGKSFLPFVVCSVSPQKPSNMQTRAACAPLPMSSFFSHGFTKDTRDVV